MQGVLIWVQDFSLESENKGLRKIIESESDKKIFGVNLQGVKVKVNWVREKLKSLSKGAQNPLPYSKPLF